MSSGVEIVERLEAGRVLSVFTPDPLEAHRAIVDAVDQSPDPPKVVSIHWQRSPALDQKLDSVSEAMARVAQSLWPHWYQPVELPKTASRLRNEDIEFERRLGEVRQIAPQLSGNWFREAWRQCAVGRLPLVKGLASQEQLRQLAMAIDPSGPLVVLAVSSSDALPGRIHSLGRAAEWLALHAHCRTVLLLPPIWKESSELDIVTYDALDWRPATVEAEPPRGGLPSTPALAPSSPDISVEPSAGEPHPLSDAEQHLHEHLQRFAELAELLRFNTRVYGASGKAYRVDLVWEAGRLAIEIDGSDHRGELKYSQDRERDFDLFLRGYSVLRFTNGHVISNVAQVIDQIRRAVDFQREHKDS